MMRTIISLACLAGAVALFFLYTKPTYDGLKGEQDRIAEYDLALDKANELQQLKQQLLSRYNSFNPDDIERLHKLLPDHVDNVRLVLDLDTLASKHGVALQNVSISAAEGVPADPSIENVVGPSLQEYGSLTLSFATSGTYPQFVKFITDLEQSLRIVDIVGLRLASIGGSGEPVYRYDIVLRTYWLK
jgi:Tfp pilus assembly protein PilO